MHPSLKLAENANLESFKSVIETAKGALNTALLVNGGSAAAMLAFCGAVASKGVGIVPPAIVAGMGSFAIGVLTAAVASGFAYLSQHAEHWDRESKSNSWRRAPIALVAASYIAFLVGAIVAGCGILNIKSVSAP